MQKELTARGPLLNEKGELHEAGYARQLVKQYDPGPSRQRHTA